MSAMALAMHTNPAKADVATPIMYASPAVQQITAPLPPTGPLPKWNISIMVANLSATYGLAISTIACSVKSLDPTKVIVRKAYRGADFYTYGFTTFLNASWNPTTGNLVSLTAAQTDGVMIDTPFEIFKIEVQATNSTPGSVVIDMYVQEVYDIEAIPNTVLSGQCPYDQTVYINAITTHTITVDSTDYNVTALSNSTIPTMIIDTNAKSLNFTTSGDDGATGYVNVTIPKTLLDCPAQLTDWIVLLNNTDYTGSAIITANSTHTFVYLAYSQSTHEIRIIGKVVVPEYPSITILLTLLATMTVAFGIIRKVHKKRWQTL